MDQYVTTYQKDYMWPSSRQGLTHVPDSFHRSVLCQCENSQNIVKSSKKQTVTSDSYDWSRLGPMGRLLDPKLYPAKTGPLPKNEATNFNQPDAYLNRVEEKYPNLYGVLQSAPMADLITRVDRDRMKSTYRVDYAGLDMNQMYFGACALTKPPVETECRSKQLEAIKRDRGPKSREANELKSKKKINKKGEDVEGAETRLPSWKTEYQDGINKIGQAVMKGKIHHTKKDTVPTWAIST